MSLYNIIISHWLCILRQEVICWAEGSHNIPSALLINISHVKYT